MAAGPQRLQHNKHAASPYSRTPQKHQAHTQTPSLLNRFKQIFTPIKWQHSQEATGSQGATDAQAVKSGADSHKKSNPIDEFHSLQTSSSYTKASQSPNEILANFFANKNKNSEPLSEIEIEGVKALLEKSKKRERDDTGERNERNESLGNISMSTPNNHGSSNVFNSHHAQGAVIKSEAQTPSFKPEYNTSTDTAGGNVLEDAAASQSAKTSRSQFKRRIFDYSGFPSPYRTCRLKSSVFAMELNNSSNTKAEAEAEAAEEKQEKKLSNTASALLSFLDNKPDEKPQAEGKESRDGRETKVNYSNPYALPSVRKQKKIPLTSTKPQVVLELEKSLDKIAPAAEAAEVAEAAEATPAPQHAPQQVHAPHAPAAVPALNKYAPQVSSSLRESETVSGGSSDRDEPEEVQPKIAFPIFNSSRSEASGAAKDPSGAADETRGAAQGSSGAVRGQHATSQASASSASSLFAFPNALKIPHDPAQLDSAKVGQYRSYFTF